MAVERGTWTAPASRGSEITGRAKRRRRARLSCVSASSRVCSGSGRARRKRDRGPKRRADEAAVPNIQAPRHNARANPKSHQSKHNRVPAHSLRLLRLGLAAEAPHSTLRPRRSPLPKPLPALALTKMFVSYRPPAFLNAESYGSVAGLHRALMRRNFHVAQSTLISSLPPTLLLRSPMRQKGAATAPQARVPGRRTIAAGAAGVRSHWKPVFRPAPMPRPKDAS